MKKRRRPSVHRGLNRRIGWDKWREDNAERLRVKALKDPKTCSNCRYPKEKYEFASYLVNGVRHWHSRCNHCRSKLYSSSPTCQRKRKLITDLKDKPCHDCGHDFKPHCMSFVLNEGQQCFNIETSWTGRSDKSIVDESVKYIVVCANCLAERNHQLEELRRPSVSKLAILATEVSEPDKSAS